jgi:hypothetical protein
VEQRALQETHPYVHTNVLPQPAMLAATAESEQLNADAETTICIAAFDAVGKARVGTTSTSLRCRTARPSKLLTPTCITHAQNHSR